MNTYTAIAFSIATGLASAAGAQAVSNGDLTGPVGSSIAPTDWFSWSGSVDTCDPAGPFNLTGNPWVLSPNGGTFVRAGSNGTGVNEAFAQDLTGFTAGQLYTVEFYTTNLGFNGSGWTGADGFFRMFADGVAFGDSVTLTKQAVASDDIVWTFGTLDFVAPANDFELAIASQWISGGDTAAYMGMDGINIRTVPAPVSAVLLGAAGLVATRRRR
jgi:predicted RNA-binding protein with TRAM domain